MPAATSFAFARLSVPAFGADVVKGRILVQPRAGLESGEFARILSARGAKALGWLGDLDVDVVELPANASEHAVAALIARNPHIKFAEPDQLLAPDLLPNYTHYGSEWHLQMVQAQSRRRGSSIVASLLGALKVGDRFGGMPSREWHHRNWTERAGHRATRR